jgi:hypothetical protein
MLAVMSGRTSVAGVLLALAIARAPAVEAQPAKSTGRYRDNLTSEVAVPYIGGTDAGNNQ